MFANETVLECIFMRKMNFLFKDITLKTGVNRKTIYRWCSKYKDNIEHLFQKKKRRFFLRSKLVIPQILHEEIKNTADILRLLSEFIDRYPNCNKRNMKAYFYNNFHINISLNTLTKYLKRLNITKKKISKCVVKDISFLQELIQKRETFINEIKSMNTANFIFLDETCINEKTNISDRGYSTKGSNIHLPVPSLYGKKSNIIMAMSEDKILDFQIQRMAYNSFLHFLQKLCSKNPNKIILCDNVAFHKTKKAKELASTFGCSLLFIPPYSPNMNPIENVFSKLKSIHKDNNFYNIYNLGFENNTNLNSVENVTKSVMNLIDYCERDNIEYLRKSVYSAIHHNSYKEIEQELKKRIHFVSYAQQ